MKLKPHTDYAIQILQHIHKHEGELHGATRIVGSIGLSYPVFIKITGQLKRKGLIRVIPGRNGGYRLGKPADKINVYDVFSCMEGELQIQDHQPCDKDKMHTLVCGLQEKTIQAMSGMSIAELASDSSIEHLSATTQTLKAQTERLYRIETIDKEIHDIPLDEIILIQSSLKQGLLELHREQGLLKFRGMITRIAIGIPEFFHSHISFVVNINHIQNVDVVNQSLILTNGRAVPIAKQKIKRLLHLMDVKN